MDGYSVADLAAMKAIVGANAPEFLGLRSTDQWYRFASGDSLAGNDEWIIRLTDDSGNYYPMGAIQGTTTPTGASTKSVTYRHLNGSNDPDIIYHNAGGGSTVWTPFSSGAAGSRTGVYTSTATYYEIPLSDGNTVLVQFGTATSSGGSVVINLPATYANTDYSIVGSVQTGSANNDRTVGFNKTSGSQATAYVTVDGSPSGASFSWRAEGLKV